MPMNSAEDYKPVLPDGVNGVTIDASHQHFKAAQKLAFDNGLTQQQFSALLGHEARRVLDARKPASPAPDPGKIPGYDKMSFAQKIAAGEAMRRARER